MIQTFKDNRTFLVISLLIVLVNISNSDKNTTNLLVYNCGNEPIDFVNLDISNNPNFVFENDPLYNTVQLFDQEGNTVFVNSYIECKHYTEGGWFKPGGDDQFKQKGSSLYKIFGSLLLILIIYFYSQSLHSHKINKNNIINFAPIILFSFIYLIIQSKIINRGLYFPILENNQNLKIISLSLLTGFLFLISDSIKKTFNLTSLSLSLTYFLLSFFAFDFLFLPLTRNIRFQTSFLIVSSLWLIVFLFKEVSKKNLFSIAFLYSIIFLFNNIYDKKLKEVFNYRILNNDVEVQWLPLVSLVHDNNLFYAYSNSLIDGYGMLLSYVQAIIHKLIFFNSAYEFSTLDPNLILLFSLFLFFDLDISKINKLVLVSTYFLIILDDGWLRFLMGNSLMQEGLVSFLFATFVINIVKSKLLKSTFYQNIIYVSFLSLLILSKQFVETLVILLLFYIVQVVRNKLVLLPFAIFYSLYQIYNSFYFTSVSDIEYIDKPIIQVFLDIILIRNPNWNNIANIISKLFEYKFLFFALLLIIIFAKNLNELSKLITLIIGLNILFIFLLYIFIWQNVETDSSFRYLMNTGHLIFICLFTQLDHYQKKKIAY